MKLRIVWTLPETTNPLVKCCFFLEERSMGGERKAKLQISVRINLNAVVWFTRSNFRRQCEAISVANAQWRRLSLRHWPNNFKSVHARFALQPTVCADGVETISYGVDSNRLPSKQTSKHPPNSWHRSTNTFTPAQLHYKTLTYLCILTSMY